jgi:hypothetical protein
MEVSGDKESTRIFLDISSLYVHTGPKRVQAVITHNETFQPQAIDHILLLKPFLDPGFDGVVRSDFVSSDFHVFGKLKKKRHFRVWRLLSDDTVKAGVQ